MFMYKIFSDGSDETMDQQTKFPKLCFSLWLKTKKSKALKEIWQYHKFSK